MPVETVSYQLEIGARVQVVLGKHIGRYGVIRNVNIQLKEHGHYPATYDVELDATGKRMVAWRTLQEHKLRFVKGKTT